jgi:hypothetical protein
VKTEQSAGATRPRPTEYLFREVPQAELEACFIYEYARELARRSPRMSELLSKWKASWRAPKRAPKRKEGRKAAWELTNIMRACFPNYSALMLAIDFFPDTPWRELDEKTRLGMVDDVNQSHTDSEIATDNKLSIATLRELEAPNIRSIEAFRHVHEVFSREDLGQTEYGFFSINWDYDVPDITRVFEKWLKDQRQKRKKRGLTEVKYKPKGRGRLRDQLNWLGGFRVRENFRKKEIVNDDPQQSLNIPDRPYSNYPELCVGAKKGRQVVEVLLNRIR